jgi:lipopolysaccharide transport system ATP-binding protein
MSDVVVRVENLGKKYIINHQEEGFKTASYKSLRDAISNGARSLSQKLVRHSEKEVQSSSSEEFWALNNVSFEIKQGEVVGIIGRNGAGKSTILKILSRITEPTRGRISIEGRVASLLEVGTGFHPELTGRENVFLNGSILGMSKVEISQKFDEIVAFAEIEKFLDTPVKRYSSGMYVRLAFSVAAHLEPEILIVDEVLAVGDASFQKKCLGKIGDISTREGRTVLFVSHTMKAVSQLTNRCILLSKGDVQFDGHTDTAVSLYLAEEKSEPKILAYYEAPSNKTKNHIAWARVHTSEEKGEHTWGKPMTVEFALEVPEPNKNLRFSFQIVSKTAETPVLMFYFFNAHQAPFCQEAGTFILRCEIPRFRLYMGSYTLTTWLGISDPQTGLENLREICLFKISQPNVERPDYPWAQNECVYLEDADWKVIKA